MRLGLRIGRAIWMGAFVLALLSGLSGSAGPGRIFQFTLTDDGGFVLGDPVTPPLTPEKVYVREVLSAGGFEFVVLDGTEQPKALAYGTRLSGEWLSSRSGSQYELSADAHWKLITDDSPSLGPYEEILRFAESSGEHWRKHTRDGLHWEPWKTYGLAAQPYGLADYVKECREAGVDIPQAPLNCDDPNLTQVVPIYRTPAPGAARVEISEQNYDTYSVATNGCDNPAQLHSIPAPGRCIPGSRLGQIHRGDTTCLFFCRRYQRTAAGMEPFYQDINMICHAENGATCFFNTVASLSTDGRNLYPPGHPSETRWMDMSEYSRSVCIKCHDKGPFIVTPYVKKLGIVPQLDSFSSYFVVGSQAPFNDNSWKERYRLAGPQAAACTRCHRISYPSSCGDLMRIATGWERPPGANVDCPELNAKVMPPTRGLTPERSREFDAAIGYVNYCCKEVTAGRASSCDWQPIYRRPGVFSDGILAEPGVDTAKPRPIPYNGR